MPVGDPRRKTFTFVVTDKERQSIDELAEKLDRTAGDAVRHVVQHAVDGVRTTHQDGGAEETD